MNITITGRLGSGKSSICSELQKAGYNVITAGTIFRDIADAKGMSVVELNIQARSDPSIDCLIDKRTAELGRVTDRCIFDCRLGWYFIPDSLKVFADVEIQTAAMRIMNDHNRAAEAYLSIDEAVAAITMRQELERARYINLYGADIYDLDNYDLVLDSTNRAPAELAADILALLSDHA